MYSDFDHWELRRYEHGGTGVKTAVGIVSELSGDVWNHNFYQRPLVLGR